MTGHTISPHLVELVDQLPPPEDPALLWPWVIKRAGDIEVDPRHRAVEVTVGSDRRIHFGVEATA